MNTTDIEPYFIKENQLVGLGFPDQGYVFWKISSVKNVFYRNYTESPGTIAATTYVDSERMPMDAYSIDNLLRIEQCDHVYQIFMGWEPGVIRRYDAYPYEQMRGNIDTKNVYTKSDFGYITGYDSPTTRPSPMSESWVPKDVEIGFSWWNPTNVSEDVVVDMLIRRLKVEVLRDADLIEKILKGSQPCRIASLGDIAGSLEYNSRSKLDIGFIKLDATRTEIAAAVA